MVEALHQRWYVSILPWTATVVCGGRGGVVYLQQVLYPMTGPGRGRQATQSDKVLVVWCRASNAALEEL